jgi:hypothetical protein
MKCLQILLVFLVLVVTTWPARPAVLVDDSWIDGTRDDTNLPEESAWFANNTLGSPTLTVETGALTGNILMFGTNSSSRLWITHFTEPAMPADLAVGEKLTVSAVFTLANVGTSANRGIRIGLFNFSESGAARVTADGFSTGAGTGAPGAFVSGYMLSAQIAQTLAANPLQISKRTDTNNVNLMGAAGVYTTISSGGQAGPGFIDGQPYQLDFTAKHGDGWVEITTTFSDTNGWSTSHTATDSLNPYFRFDGFALRPATVEDTANSFTFTRFKAVVEPFAFGLRITSIQPTLEGVTLTWDSTPNRTYHIEVRESLGGEGFWATLGTVVATGTSASFTDVDAAFATQRFYRLVESP